MNSYDAIEIEPVWTARVEISHRNGVVRRNVEAPAPDAATANERMTTALDFVWGNPRWVFISKPRLKGEPA